LIAWPTFHPGDGKKRFSTGGSHRWNDTTNLHRAKNGLCNR